MKKLFTILFTAASLLIIFDTLNASHAFALFFLAGVIPGTNTSLSADQMLNLFAALLGFTFSRVLLNVVRLISKRDNTLSPELQLL